MADKDNNVVKSIDKVSDKLESIEKTIREVSAKPKEPENNEDREFQLRILEYQREYDATYTFIAVIIGVGFTLGATIGAISYTSIAESLRIYLTYIALASMVIVAAVVSYLAYFEKCVMPRKLEDIRRNFVEKKQKKLTPK